MRIFFGLILSTVLVLPVSANDDDGREQASEACRIMSDFAMGAALGTMTGGTGNAIQRGFAAAGIGWGSRVLQDKCTESVIEFARHYSENPIDYEDYIREQCGGNPMNCPGGLNVFPDPGRCLFIIDCAQNPLGRMNYGGSAGLSVQDIIDQMYYAEYSWKNGSWGNTSPPPGSFDVY